MTLPVPSAPSTIPATMSGTLLRLVGVGYASGSEAEARVVDRTTIAIERKEALALMERPRCSSRARSSRASDLRERGTSDAGQANDEAVLRAILGVGARKRREKCGRPRPPR